MELVWDLSELFLNVDAWTLEYSALKEDVFSFDVSAVHQTEEIVSLIEILWEWKERLGKLEVYANLKYYSDIQNPKYIQMKEDIVRLQQECETIFLSNEQVLLKWISIYPEIMNDSKYQVYLRRLQRRPSGTDCEFQEWEEEQANIQSLILQYNQLKKRISFKSILVDGKETPLSFANLNSYLAFSDRSVRLETFQVLNEAYEEISQDSFQILQSILKKRVRISRLKKYPSILEMEFAQEQIPKSLFELLVSSVHHSLPYFQEYFRLKAKYLDIKDPHLYDLGVPFCHIRIPKVSLTDGIQQIQEALKPLGSDYWNHVLDLIQRGHFDTSLNALKHPTITFSWYGYSFLHFRGAYLDVKNLIHELGHSMNDLLSLQSNPYVLAISGVFTGEIASIVNEILFSQYCIQHAKTKEEKIYFLSKEIENYVSSVFRQMMFIELEQKLYEALEKDESFSLEEVSFWYQSLLQEYYGNAVSIDSIVLHEWLRFERYYRYSYYSYTYATGLLLAHCVVFFLMQGRITSQEYLNFLKAGNSKDPGELLKMLHISLDDPQIFEFGFAILKQDLEYLQELLN